MTTPGGEWVAVPVPGEADRWDFVPAEQPPSPDGSSGTWHVVGGSGTEVGKWEWFPAPGYVPPPPPPAPLPWENPAPPSEPEPMPWETSAPDPSPSAPTPSAPAAAWGEQPTEPVSRDQPPVLAGPAPAGWHTPPPVGAVPPKRSLKLPLAIVGTVVVVALIGVGTFVALSGGDDGKNKEEITALVNYVATVDDGQDVCSSHLTDSFVDTVFGDVATCERDDDEDDDESDDATGATVTDIEIDDDTATATVTVIGGDTDGATGTWAFLRGEDEMWRVSEWRADYLRSSFERTFGENYDSDGPDDPFEDSDVRSCVKDQLLGQDDPDFLDTAYQLFRDSDESVEKLIGFMSECPSDIEGVSALRALFEKGFRASAQLPPAVTECIVLGMRSGLSEEDIRDLSVNRGGPMPADIQSRLEQITLGCAGGSQTFDPPPQSFEPPAFGT